MILFFIPFIFLLLIIVCHIISFNRTTYHYTTGNSYFSTVFDKGRYGEFLISKNLSYLEKQGAKFLFNVYFPKENGETTESDVILITSRGFIVFESKNYSGWIFGDEKQRMWTQTLPQGKGRPAHKEKFFNPIMQNDLHIKYLRSVVGTEYSIQSIIAFSERCELKKVTVTSSDVQVVKRNHIRQAVKTTLDRMPQNAITTEQIGQFYNLLVPYSQVSEEIKQQHIQNINDRHGSKDEVPTASHPEADKKDDEGEG